MKKAFPSNLYKTIFKNSCLFLLVVLLLPGCTFYRTISVDQVTPEIIETITTPEKIKVIHNDREDEDYLFTKITIENNILKGIVEPAPEGSKHPDHKKSFHRTKAKAYKPLNTIHIYTSIKNISPGPLEIHINDIRLIDSHENDTMKSGLLSMATVTIVAAAVGTGVFLFVLLSAF